MSSVIRPTMPSAADFDLYLGSFVKTIIEGTEIRQSGRVNGIDFSLTILLDKWAGLTDIPKIVTVSRLFWQCYPKMHARFGTAGESPTDVRLRIENEGYGIAWAAGNLVHLHDRWLHDNPNDFDCLTHEFAHVIQNGWDGDSLEYSDYIERFADCCRYLYAFENGKYNDGHWQLQTIRHERDRKSSVRFLVWLDHFYSTEENDLLLNFFAVCRSERYPTSEWDKAWEKILSGSALADLSIDKVFEMYATSEFAALSSLRREGESALLASYPLRKW